MSRGGNPSYSPRRRRTPVSISPLVVLILIALSGLISHRAWSASPPATWTTGHKKVLIIPVRFTDLGGPSDLPSAAGYYSGWGNIANGSKLAEITNLFAWQSYGKCTVEFTLLPEINLGVSYLSYTNPLSADSSQSKLTRWSDPGSIMDDARAKARQVGTNTATPTLYDTDNYDLDIMAVLAQNASLAVANARVAKRLRAAEERLKKENAFLKTKDQERRTGAKKDGLPEIIGSSSPMKHAARTAKACNESSILMASLIVTASPPIDNAIVLMSLPLNSRPSRLRP